MRCTPSTSLVHIALLSLIALPASAQFDPAYPGRSLPVAPVSGNEFANGFTVADVDNDGHAEVLALHQPNWHTLELCVSRTLPDGGLAAMQTWPVNWLDVDDLTVADIDANGWPDVVMCTWKQRVVVAYGTGGGKFGFSADYFVGSGPLRGVRVVDVNHDGLLDLLTGSEVGGSATTGTINVNLADGTGGFLGAQYWPAGNPVAALDTGDLDGDGWVDVVTVSSDPGTLQIILSDGAGGFRAPQPALYAHNGARQVLLGDLNGDGRPDAVVIAGGPSGTYASDVRPYLNDGAGGLLVGTGVGGGMYAYSGLLRDLDLDGDLDVLAVYYDSFDVAEVLNDGHGVLALGPQLPVGVTGQFAGFVDVTGDGHDDLLVRGFGATAVVLPAAPDGLLPPCASWSPSTQLNCVSVGDVDGDGWQDVFYAVKASAQSGVLLGSPFGFAWPPVKSPGFADSPFVSALGDLTGDGLLDAVVVSVYTSAHVTVEPGLGDGSFGPALVATVVPTGGTPVTAHLLDLDSDGWMDVAVGLTGLASRVDVFLNSGAAQPGQPGSPQIFLAGARAEDFDFGDLDGDGVPDAVMACSPAAEELPSTLVVRAGDGHGALLEPVSVNLPPAPTDALRLRVGDLDLDGFLDAAVTFGDGAVLLAAGDGTGALLPGQLLPAASGGGRLVLGDVDGDGWPDVVSAGTVPASDIVVRRGDGAGGLLAPELHANAAMLDKVTLADMDRDGRPDLVLTEKFTFDDHRLQVIDNVHHTFTWTDLQHAKPGSFGLPSLTGTGELVYGTPGALHLAHAAPSALAALVVGIGEQPTAWKGGVLMPAPPQLLTFRVTDAEGRVLVPWTSWPDATPGASVTMQFVIADGGPNGVSLSNALRATEPD